MTFDIFLAHAVLEFLSEPAPHYYLLSGSVALIPCHVVETLPPNDIQSTVSATFFLNSTPLDPRAGGSRLLFRVDDAERVTALIILQVEAQDSQTVVHCSVVRGGVEVLRSQNSTILVGGTYVCACECVCVS